MGMGGGGGRQEEGRGSVPGRPHVPQYSVCPPSSCTQPSHLDFHAVKGGLAVVQPVLPPSGIEHASGHRHGNQIDGLATGTRAVKARG